MPAAQITMPNNTKPIISLFDSLLFFISPPLNNKQPHHKPGFAVRSTDTAESDCPPTAQSARRGNEIPDAAQFLHRDIRSLFPTRCQNQRNIEAAGILLFSKAAGHPKDRCLGIQVRCPVTCRSRCYHPVCRGNFPRPVPAARCVGSLSHTAVSNRQ